MRKSLLLLFFTLVVGWLVWWSFKSALANSGCGPAPFVWCSWDIKIDFPEDRLRVIYTVSVGDYKGMTPVIIAQQSLDISERCRHLGGAITIKAAVAYFDGGYYECERPSFAEIVRELTDGQAQLPDVCQCKSPAAAFNGSFAEPGRHPLLYREDGQFYVTLTHGGEVAITTLATNTAQNTSAPWVWRLGDEIRLWSGSLDDTFSHFTQLQLPSHWFDFLLNSSIGQGPTFMAASSKGVYGSFFHWSEGAAPTYQAVKGAAQLQTGSQTFYIGYDPNNSEIFRGAMQNLWDDPGCFGNK